MNLSKCLSVLFCAGLATGSAFAETTVTVSGNETVTVTQPVPVQAVTVVAGDFEGRIVEIEYPRSLITVQDGNGARREVAVKPEMINNYRIGDYILVRSTTEVSVITVEENPKDFEGVIIRVEMSDNRMVIQDTTGRERRVELKKGMIGTYKVDDYVRVHLMADMKEAKTIETLRDVNNLEGRIVGLDAARSRIVVRDNDGKESAVFVRQGHIESYRMGDSVQIYLLPNHEQAQVVRVVR